MHRRSHDRTMTATIGPGGPVPCRSTQAHSSTPAGSDDRGRTAGGRPRRRRRRPRPRRADRLHAARRRPGELVTSDRPAASTRPRTPRPSPTCKTGADANAARRLPDRRLRQQHPGVLAASSSAGAALRAAQTVLFTGRRRPAAARERRPSGPFYCPADRRSTSTSASSRSCSTRFGAKGGPFAAGLRRRPRVRPPRPGSARAILQPGGASTGAEGGSVRTELQADCYAGVWAHHAAATGLPPAADRRTRSPTALDAAAAVGDDRIQEATQGRVDPESWTHGSSEQRQQWFTTATRRASRRLRHVQPGAL